MIHSEVKVGGRVSFPANNSERVYMLPFFQRDGLPLRLSRWQRTVDEMLAGIRTDRPIYLMIDQGIVGGGQTQRRPGLHIEMNWDAGNQYHAPQHRGSCVPEMVVLASDVGGCRALVGKFDGDHGPKGECDHVNVGNGREILFAPSIVYRGTVTTIHESLPMIVRMERTLVRLNLPGVA
jgi:hypothetical protein